MTVRQEDDQGLCPIRPTLLQALAAQAGILLVLHLVLLILPRPLLILKLHSTSAHVPRLCLPIHLQLIKGNGRRVGERVTLLLAEVIPVGLEIPMELLDQGDRGPAPDLNLCRLLPPRQPSHPQVHSPRVWPHPLEIGF